MPHDEIMKQIKGVDALYCMIPDKIDKAVIEAAGPQLKCVCTMTVGFDHVDIETCKKHNIPVGHTPHILSKTTAECAVTLLFAVMRGIYPANKDIRDGNWGTWVPLQYCGMDLHSSTVGVIGMGKIGLEFAKMLQGFGCKVLYADDYPNPGVKELKYAQQATMDEVLRKCDIISIHCALTDKTKNLINKDSLKLMKKNAILINTSRGPVVDHDALYNALKNHEIGGAGLDVTVPEPLSKDSPFLQLDNCFITPHIASASINTRSGMARMTSENVIAALRGEKMPYGVPGYS